MQNKPSTSTSSTSARRTFLLGAGAASVAGATALVVSQKSVPSRTVKTSKAGVPEGKGYQLSEHVRSYYRTTTI